LGCGRVAPERKPRDAVIVDTRAVAGETHEELRLVTVLGRAFRSPREIRQAPRLFIAQHSGPYINEKACGWNPQSPRGLFAGRAECRRAPEVCTLEIARRNSA